jgi:hypothetical protein
MLLGAGADVNAQGGRYAAKETTQMLLNAGAV